MNEQLRKIMAEVLELVVPRVKPGVRPLTE